MLSFKGLGIFTLELLVMSSLTLDTWPILVFKGWKTVNHFEVITSALLVDDQSW